MATTDARTGFRLPWSSDQRAQTDESDTLDATARPDGSGTTAETVASDQEAPASTGAAVDEMPTTPEPVEPTAESGETPPASAEPVDDGASEASAAVDASIRSGSTPHDAGVPSGGSGRRPTKFLAELTRAMQAAAQTARDEAVSRLQADAKAFGEQIHARSAEESADLRRRADDDVATIREWSKAEIARIREETEQKITERKSRLEHEIEEHAGLIERQIERIHGRVGSFEQQMERFFERLLAEEDPTRIAAMAENLPDAPAFDADELFAEAAAWAWTEMPDAAEAPADETPTGAIGAADAVVTSDPIVAGDQVVTGDPLADPTTEGTGPADPWTEVSWSDSASQEAAFAAIQAAAEAAESAEGAEPWTTGQALEADAGRENQAGVQVASVEHAGEHPNVGAEDASAEDDPAVAHRDTADDPRLAMLGLAPESAAAAEAEAEAEVAGETNGAGGEAIPPIDDDALAARLAGLVPPDADPVDAATTRVTVVGLISVASIAGFKRQLAKLDGVRSVGVSSGPEGEFIFTVSHGPEAALADTIPTLPGFGAQITSSGEGMIAVTARDPETDA